MKKILFIPFLVLLSISAFCGRVDINLPGGGSITGSYTIGGAVQGLAVGDVLILQNNGGDDATITGSGNGIDTFIFNRALSTGEAYFITIFSQPPGKSCTVGGNVGTVSNTNISTITVLCGVSSYVIGGSVANLAGSGLVLRNNGIENLTIGASGPFAFPTTLLSGDAYNVTIAQQPSNPSQTCTFDLANNSGVTGTTDVTNINVTCVTNSFAISGTVSGLLPGDSIVIQNNGGSNQTLDMMTPNFSFAAQFDGTPYDVTISSVAGSATCNVTNGTGILTGAAVTNVSISCFYPGSYTVGGTLSGLNGGTLVLRNNIDTITLSTNGSFTFPLSWPNGTSYNVLVDLNPVFPSQTCTVASGTGTITSAVTNVAVNCVTNQFAVGGTVSGIPSGESVTITNNGINPVILNSASTSFAFPLQNDSSIYNVEISSISAAVNCTVGGGLGILSGGDVVGISIVCGGLTARTIGGTVTGLSGGPMPPRTGLVIQNNGGDDLTITGNGSFVFPTPMYDTDAYSVTVSVQPTNPGEVCTLANAAGIVNGNSINSISVTCSLNSYAVSGLVSGLSSSEQVVLQNNGAGNIAVIGGGSGTDGFTFPPQNDLSMYNITVLSSPSGKTCTTGANSGLISAGNINNVTVNCSVNPTYSIGGTISGLSSTGTIVLQNDYGTSVDQIILNGTVSSPLMPFTFTFSKPLAAASNYSISMVSQPTSPNQNCILIGGSGTVVASNVNSISLNCSTLQYSITGQITGLGFMEGVVLQLGGTNNLTVTGGGTGIDSFSFDPVKVTDGQAYNVVVLTPPAGKTCTAGANSGVVNGGVVNSITISCSTIPTYSVGGAVLGLASGNTIALQNNGTDNLVLSANGSFTFSTPLKNGDPYNVQVLTQPTTPNQSCTVSGGSGTVASSHIGSVIVNCVTVKFTVGGSVTGLNPGDPVILLNNNANPVELTADGTFSFPLQDDGTGYNVTIQNMPTTTTCVIGSNPGTVAGANVNSVTVTCSALPTYTIGGTVNGLVGSGLVLLNNGADNLSINADGMFTFATPKNIGNTYSVSILTQPSAPAQVCSVTNASGTVAGTVGSVSIDCVLVTYSLSGTISGLGAGDIVYLTNNWNDYTSVTGSGTGTDTFYFPRALNQGDFYSVWSHLQTPNFANGEAGIECNSGSGNAWSNVNLAGICWYTYSISATVTGLPVGYSFYLAESNYGGGVWVYGTGLDQVVTLDAPFIPTGGSYSLYIGTSPAMPYTCSVTSGQSGVMGISNITTGITVSCVNVSVPISLNTYFPDSGTGYQSKPYYVTGLNPASWYAFMITDLVATATISVYSDPNYSFLLCSSNGILPTCSLSGNSDYYIVVYNSYWNTQSYKVSVSDYTTCGDAQCLGFENVVSCPADCPPICGDAMCNGAETTGTCPGDCPAVPVCGDGTCSTGETPASCSSECGILAASISPGDTWSGGGSDYMAFVSGSLALGADQWYKFTANGTDQYVILWDDITEGTATKTGDVTVSAYDSSGTPFFVAIDSGFLTPQIISPAAGTVYIQVSASVSGGTYGLNVLPHQPITINLGSYTAYSIPVSKTSMLVSFPVVSGLSYTVNWDDAYSGSGSYSADVWVTGYIGNPYGGNYFFQSDSGYFGGPSFFATATGQVYLEVNTNWTGGIVGVRVNSP